MASPDIIPRLIFLTGCLTLSLCTSLPGLQIRISKKGLDYSNTIALRALSTQLDDLNIPNQRGKSDNVEWSLGGISNRGVTVPSSAMNFDASHNGLTWAVGGLGIDLHASHWRVKYKKGWFKVSTSGSVDVKIKRVSLRVTISLGQADGRPSVSMARCLATIGDVDVYFYGGTSFILNLFRGIIGNKIKSIMQGEICGAARKLVNLDLNKELSHLKVNVNLGPNFMLDYSLVAPPEVMARSLELKNKGEIYWKRGREEAPFSPKPLPELADQSHMMYLWVSDFVANSAIHHAYKHGFLQYNVTDKDFLSDAKSFLDTSCSMFCVGNLLPILGEAFPNSKMEARVTALGTPKLAIRPEGMSLNGNAQLDLHIVDATGKIDDVVNIDMEVFLSVMGSVVHERLAGEITEYKLQIKSIKSILGDIDPEGLNEMLKAALDLGIIPGLNAEMRKGLDLPVTQVLSFKETELTLLDGSVLIATDITAYIEPPTQEEIQEELLLRKQRQQQQQLLLLQRQQQQQKEKEEQEQQEQRQQQQQQQQKEKEEQEQQQQQQQQQEQQQQEEEKSELVVSTVASKLLTEKDNPVTNLDFTSQLPTTSSDQQDLSVTEQPTMGSTMLKELEETTPQPQERKQTTQGQGQITQSAAHQAYCDRVMSFCHASINFCT